MEGALTRGRCREHSGGPGRAWSGERCGGHGDLGQGSCVTWTWIKEYPLISLDAEKASDEGQHPVILKTLSCLDPRGLPLTWKVYLLTPSACVTLSGRQAHSRQGHGHEEPPHPGSRRRGTNGRAWLREGWTVLISVSQSWSPLCASPHTDLLLSLLYFLLTYF